MLTTFVDTGAFFAFSDRNDRYHEMAVRQFAKLLNGRVPLVITNFIIDESYTWLRYRLGHRPAIAFLNRVRDAEKLGALEIATITRTLEEQATRILERFGDQDLSYTDATSLTLIEERQLKRAFTFDHHFHLAHIEIIPGFVR